MKGCWGIMDAGRGVEEQGEEEGEARHLSSVLQRKRWERRGGRRRPALCLHLLPGPAHYVSLFKGNSIS